MIIKQIINTELVKSLIKEQFPVWQNLLVKPIAVQGWDNRTFHLGGQMLVRLPSAEEYALKIAKEQQWLPKLAPLLPLSIPETLAMGEANEYYPYPWSVYRWIEGNNAASLPIINIENFAIDLAQFIIALQNIDITAGPQPMPGDFAYIKNGLAYYDAEMRCAIDLLKNQIDANIATEIWEQALATTWQKAPVWVHSDISAGNLIIFDGKLRAVIDFGGLSIGDPACDLVIAYSFFGKEARKIFKQSLSFDIGTWQRARGWALWKAMIVAANLTETNMVETSGAWPTIKAIIADYQN